MTRLEKQEKFLRKLEELLKEFDIEETGQEAEISIATDGEECVIEIYLPMGEGLSGASFYLSGRPYWTEPKGGE